MSIFDLIFVWGVAAIILIFPTALVVMWAICREPSASKAKARRAAPQAAKGTPNPHAAGRA